MSNEKFTPAQGEYQESLDGVPQIYAGNEWVDILPEQTEFQRGCNVGMAVMRAYIADCLQRWEVQDDYGVMYSKLVRDLPNPTYKSSGEIKSPVYKIGDRVDFDGVTIVCTDKD